MSWRTFVRYWMPGLICLAGFAAMIFGPEESRAEGGGAILAAGLSIYLINILFRVGVSGDREREDEQKARDFYTEHGHWPDDHPPTGGPA
jgi:hypothetical protein